MSAEPDLARADLDYEVLIVGYGPSGVTAANFLGQYGIRTGVFERAADIYSRARAVTVDEYTLRIFQQAGLDRKLLADMDPRSILRWKTYAGKEFLRITPSESGYGQPASPMIYQPAVEKTLREGADRYPGTLDVNLGYKVLSVADHGGHVEAEVEAVDSGARRTVRARYLLACDGGSSTIRESLGAKMLGRRKETRWVIVDAKVKKWWPERDVLTFWSDPHRPVVDIPLALGHHRWELPLRAHEKQEDFESRESLWALLEPFGVTGEHVEILQHAFYSHNVLMAEKWRHGNVFLVGDAAHMMPPWAGQGMQSGIRDAHNISWKLREVLAGRMPEALLDDYQAEREPHVREMTQLAETLGFMIEEANPVKVAVRNNALPLLQRLPFVGKVIREFRFKPKPMVKAGFLASKPSSRSAVGRMVPQPAVAAADGTQIRFDDVLGDGFAVVGLGQDPREVLSAGEFAAWEGIGARFVTVRSVHAGPAADTDVIDYDDVLVPWGRRYGSSVLALRPDRFVAASDSTGMMPPVRAGDRVAVGA